MGIPSNPLDFYDVDPINTGWENSEDGMRGSEGAIIIHVPSFPPIISYPDPLAWFLGAVLHSSTSHIHNLAPPAAAPPQIPLPPPSKNCI